MTSVSMLSYVAVVAMMVLTPGPNIAIILQSVITRSAGSGFGNLLGIVGGFYFHALCSVAGLTLLMQQSPTLYSVVRALGAAYLVYLGVNSLRQAWRERQAASTTSVPSDQAGAAGGPLPTTAGDASAHPAPPPPQPGRRAAVMEGFITNVLNPKVGMFYLAIFPQFIGPQDSVAWRALQLVSIHAAVAFSWYSLLIVWFNRHRARLGSPSMVTVARFVIGVVLVGLGLRVLLA